jgi:hypothetical protein
LLAQHATVQIEEGRKRELKHGNSAGFCWNIRTTSSCRWNGGRESDWEAVKREKTPTSVLEVSSTVSVVGGLSGGEADDGKGSDGFEEHGVGVLVCDGVG